MQNTQNGNALGATVLMPQQGTMSVVNVTVPNGATPGMVLSVQTAHGMQQITIPQGAVAGQTLQVSVPAPQLKQKSCTTPIQEQQGPTNTGQIQNIVPQHQIQM